MKKILHCLEMPHSTYIGGVAAMINSYMANAGLFEKNDYEEEIFDYENSFVNKIKISPLRMCLYGIFQSASLKNYIKKESVDIVHIHTSRNTLFFKDVILGSSIKRKTGVNVVMTVHVGDISTVFEKIPDRVKRWLIKLLNNNFSIIIFLTKKIQAQFIDAGLQKEKATVLYNFSALNASRDLIVNTNKPLRLLFVGMINRAKGILELLDAMSMIDDSYDIQLAICGEITEDNIEEEFKSKINILFGKVTLLGYVAGEEKKRIFETSDILVLPSHHEGFPLVILEALSSGCAIISTPVGAIPEVLSSENCFFVDVNNPIGIKEAIEKLYNDRQMVFDMGRCNLLLSEHFSKENHINKLCAIYNEII